jgi:NADPH-dependent 2,4-dienoyl-CoA reductase/sulfur reductase-like enzyme
MAQMDSRDLEFVVLGAGPAGLAAAAIFARNEKKVLLIDQYQIPGGQYWRHKYGEKFPSAKFEFLINSPFVEWRLETTVWQIEQKDQSLVMHLRDAGGTTSIRTSKLLISTGAIERSIPIPGWTLPGVITAGGLQSLVKGHSTLPGNSIVLGGSGPFLFPVIESLLDLKNPPIIKGVFEYRSNFRWWRNALGLILNPEKAFDAIKFLRFLKRQKIRFETGVKISKIEATNSGLKIHLAKKGKSHSIIENVEVAAISYGFTPDLTIPSILKLEREIVFGEEAVKVDSSQRGSIKNVWAAGEVTGIGGHELAISEGKIAALSMLDKSRSSTIAKLNRYRQKVFASGLAKIYAPSKDWMDWSTEDFIICRCEEVKKSEIIDSFKKLGADSARTSKLFTRAGMGMCQGRICHRNVSDLAERFTEGKEILSPVTRPIGGAVTLGELSD